METNKDMDALHGCNQERWQQAQESEFACWGGFEVGDGDDWSGYWQDNINGYEDLEGKTFDNVIEVGCGPFVQNLTKILEKISYKKAYALDPLLDSYNLHQKSRLYKVCESLGVIKIPLPLEKALSFEEDLEKKMDLVICNNVLDHCFDSDKCFENIYKMLNSGGYLVFGNDLKDPQDESIARDTLHPIMLQEGYLNEIFATYKTIYKKIIPREECRNPTATCGCFFGVFAKI